LAALPDTARTRAILLDIEGTTTPVDFVYSVLFPFARARMEEFLRRHYENDDVQADLDVLRRQRTAEVDAVADLAPWQDESRETRVNSAVAYIHWLMDRDRKLTALKSLQGKVWEAGYLNGALRGQVYRDVAPAFARWRRQNRAIAIFSSGSVLAQRLLFAHSTVGDLTSFIASYFDTSTGQKQDDESYRRIAAALGLEPREIVFVSDVVAELDAARRAGLQTALCVRAGLGPSEVAHPIVRTFDEVLP
jgi:enolase-phosphatase E1